MNQDVVNALELIANTTALLRLTRDEHIKIQNAIDLIETELKKVPQEKEALDNLADKALS